MNRYRDLTEFAKVGIASWPQQYVGQPASGTTMAPSSSVSVRNRLVTTAEWQGYSRNTLKTYGSIVTRFPPQLRYLNVDCSHYQAVASLPNELAMPLLEQAIRERLDNQRVEDREKASRRLSSPAEWR